MPPTLLPSQAPAAPQAPSEPGAPQVPDVVVEVPGAPAGAVVGGVPLTAQEMSALRRRRSELSRQLESAADRRAQLVVELEEAGGANRVGLEQRLQVLDARIVQLESDLAETGRQLTAAPASLLASTTESGVMGNGLSNGQVTGIAIVGIIFVLFPLAIALMRLIWKRATTPAPRLAQESAQRLQRLEQAVDAIAIEVERVSEGQRFLTRIFSDANGTSALGAGQRAAEAVRVGDADATREPRAGA